MRELIFISLIFFFLPAAAFAQKVPDSVLGDWYGESKCVGANPYCHDEVVVYHLTRSKDDGAKIHLAADKIVNGKPEEMGEFEFTYDPKTNLMTTEFPIARTGGKGVWSFKINRGKIDGTLTILPENEIGRRVHVEKKKPKS